MIWYCNRMVQLHACINQKLCLQIKWQKNKINSLLKVKHINCSAALLPCDSISIKLQELEQLMSFLSISCLFFCCQSVIGHQQRMCSTSYTNRRTVKTLEVNKIKSLLRLPPLKKKGPTFCLQLHLFLPSPGVMVIFCQLLCHRL